MFHHFERMSDTGLTIARIFTLWDQVEREQGQWDFTRLRLDLRCRRARTESSSPTPYAPRILPDGWIAAPFYHAWRDLSNPALRPYSEIYLDRVVNRYKRHPAHGVWLLQNEPGIDEQGRTVCAGRHTRAGSRRNTARWRA